MKTFLCRGLNGAVLLTILILGAGTSAMAIEKAKYTVLEKNDKIEIRRYEPQIVAETLVDGDLKDAGSEGFRRLFAYISGDNTKKKSISMTTPVEQKERSEKIAMTSPVGQEKLNNRWRITFLMPAEYTLESLPEPTDERVKLVQEPARLVAAVRYSGRWSEEGYEKNKALLEDYILKNSLIAAGTPIWARYDPPFMPWFMRRNEVLIPLVEF